MNVKSGLTHNFDRCPSSIEAVTLQWRQGETVAAGVVVANVLRQSVTVSCPAERETLPLLSLTAPSRLSAPPPSWLWWESAVSHTHTLTRSHTCSFFLVFRGHFIDFYTHIQTPETELRPEPQHPEPAEGGRVGVALQCRSTNTTPWKCDFISKSRRRCIRI